MKPLKAFFSCLVTICFLFLIFSSSVKRVGAALCTKVNVYYYSYTANYDGWYAWFWTETEKGKNGKLTNSGSTYGYKASFAISESDQNSQLGLLFVHCSGSSFGWGGQQTEDFYFSVKDLTIEANGEANVYFVERAEGLFYSASEAKEAQKQKFFNLYFTDSNKIFYETSGKTVSEFSLTADGIAVKCSDPNGQKKGTLTIEGSVDFGKTYQVDCKIGNDAVSKDVTFDGVYSSQVFNDAFGYIGSDLGATYTASGTTFKLWAPVSKEVSVNLYRYGHPTKYATTAYPGDDTPYKVIPMEKGEKGVWSVFVTDNLDGVYYTYNVRNGDTPFEVVDPYAKTTGVNGLRAMVVNFSANNEKLNPQNWSTVERPYFGKNNVDAVIYESHIRDLTADSSWGGNPLWAGTYLGLTQSGTTYTGNGKKVSTGLDHLKELGITHLHLLPLMDSEMVDETKLQDEAYRQLEVDGIYNWGYMTKYFFSVDGCYSTNPYDGYARLNEFKKMVLALHQSGINVVMDVVYNHTSTAGNSNFHRIIPYYYHRSVNGGFSNGSGCGNEVASERFMVNKLITDSTTYFAQEFKIDGFRFDLMGLEDTQTMNDVYSKVSKVNSECIIYGEPWTGGTSTNTYTPADKGNMNRMPKVAAFSDATRTGIRGDNNEIPQGGWVLDQGNFDELIYGITGGKSGFYNNCSSGYSFTSPNQIVNYASCHDNYSLTDQYKAKTGWSYANPKLLAATSQALSIILTSQGVPFMEGGSEIMRHKQRDHNSYNKGDSINAIKWNKKVENYAYFEAIKTLINIRRRHPAFRQTTYSGVQKVMDSNKTLWLNNGKLIGYQLKDSNDTWNNILVLHSNSAQANSYKLPKAASSKGWEIVYSNTGEHKIGNYVGSNQNVTVGVNETIILVGNEYSSVPELPTRPGGNPVISPQDDLLTQFELYLSIIQTNNMDANFCLGAKEEVIAVGQEFLSQNFENANQLTEAYNAYVDKIGEIMKKNQVVLDMVAEFPMMPKALLAAEFYSLLYQQS